MGTWKRPARIANATVALASMLGTSNASAAVEVGSDCMANDGEGGSHFVPLAKAVGSPMPLAAPFDGVATHWTVRKGASLAALSGPERLEVYRPTGVASQVQLVALGDEGVVAGELNSFETRIPVRAEDRFSAFATSSGMGTLFCKTGNSQDIIGIGSEPLAVGDVPKLLTGTEYQVPVSVTIEPDADGDGYGDESQDGCPTIGTYQAPCAAVELRASSRVRKGAILLLVDASAAASVQVDGQVSWRIRQRRRERAAQWKRKRRIVIRLSGGTQQVAPGTTARFRIPLPQRVQRRLKALGRKVALKATIASVATDPAGQVTTDRLEVRLRGRKPR
jgi:hypothetical protein